jgi:uncharacterized protein YeeX (DUF496 family)
VRQRISANAIHALKDALTVVFWWKKDLYAYAHAAVKGEPAFLAGINWLDRDQPKRDSVGLFVDRLVREQDEHQDLLLELLVDVANMREFPQLRRVEDADLKIADARRAVAHLKSLVQPYETRLQQEQATRERIADRRDEYEARRATTAQLGQLCATFLEVTRMAPQARGFAFEKVLRELFALFDLDPKASFRVVGEQIDGGFTLDGEHFLLEAKWEQSPADRAALDVFASKVDRRSDNTLGLFIAMSGFQPTAVEAHSGKRSALILMDGGDLYAVLEGRIDLRELLRRKRRHAAMTGGILLTAAEILGSG